MWEYTDKVKEHFLNPRNVGEIENPDGVAEVGSLACGDALKLYLKILKLEDRELEHKLLNRTENLLMILELLKQWE